MKPCRTTASLAATALLGLISAAASAADAPAERVTVRAVAHFDFGKTSIEEQDRAKLLSDVGAMKDVSWQTVTATGHTDSVGSAAYNQGLGQRRASAVKAYLLSQGLPDKLVRAESKGKSVPLVDNDTEEGRAKNRRTEIVFEGVRAAK